MRDEAFSGVTDDRQHTSYLGSQIVPHGQNPSYVITPVFAHIYSFIEYKG